MAKVIIFSRVFHKHAQQAGKPTHFVEKILNGQGIDYRTQEYLHTLTVLNKRVLDLGYMDIDDLVDFQNSLNPEITESKTTTIRQSVRAKPGESFSPRIWRGKPYTLNDIIFCDNITTKSITPITISKTHTPPETLKHLYQTEGFDTEEAMKDWFLWDSKKYKMFEGFKIRF